MITKIDSELAAIKLMDENLTALDEQFLAGNLSSEELIRAKALTISDTIGCEYEVAIIMATCL